MAFFYNGPCKVHTTAYEAWGDFIVKSGYDKYEEYCSRAAMALVDYKVIRPGEDGYVLLPPIRPDEEYDWTMDH